MQRGTKCSILHMNHSAHTKVQGPKHIGSRDLRGQLQNHFFSSKSEIAHQCAGAIARGQNRRPIGSWGGQPKGPHGDFHTAQSTEPQLGSATQIIIVSRALGYMETKGVLSKAGNAFEYCTGHNEIIQVNMESLNGGKNIAI